MAVTNSVITPDFQQTKSFFARAGGLLRRKLGLAIIGYAILNLIVIATSTAVLSRAWQQVNKSQVAVPTANSQLAQSTPSVPEPIPAIAVYASKQFGVSFSYPADWEVKEGEHFLDVSSPAIAYGKYTYDGSDPVQREVRGVFKIMIGKEGGISHGDLAAKDSELIQHSTKINGRVSSYLTYRATDRGFMSLTFSGGAKFTKGSKIPYDSPAIGQPIQMGGGYWELDIPRQGHGFDEVPVGEFDRPAAFKQAIEIIKSLKKI